MSGKLLSKKEQCAFYDRAERAFYAEIQNLKDLETAEVEKLREVFVNSPLLLAEVEASKRRQFEARRQEVYRAHWANLQTILGEINIDYVSHVV